MEKPTEILVVGVFPGLTKDAIEYQIFEELTNEFRASYSCRHSFDTTLANKLYKVEIITALFIRLSLEASFREQSSDSEDKDLGIILNRKPSLWVQVY